MTTLTKVEKREHDAIIADATNAKLEQLKTKLRVTPKNTTMYNSIERLIRANEIRLMKLTPWQ